MSAYSMDDITQRPVRLTDAEFAEAQRLARPAPGEEPLTAGLVAEAPHLAEKLRDVADEMVRERQPRPHIAPNHLRRIADCLDALSERLSVRVLSEADEPDMWWLDSDPEMALGSADEVMSLEYPPIGYVEELQCAVRQPNVFAVRLPVADSDDIETLVFATREEAESAASRAPEGGKPNGKGEQVNA